MKPILALTAASLMFYAGKSVAQPAATKTASPQQIVIDLKKKGAPVSPAMFGAFFEEINHAGDGGLYAELVQNRSFEDAQMPEGFTMRGNILVPPQVKNHLTGQVTKIPDYKLEYNTELARGWTLLSPDPAIASMKITKERPRATSAPNNLEVTVTKAGQSVSLKNSGYWGMGVQAGGKYRFRAIVRTSPDYKGTIEARLLSEAGKVLATQRVAINKKDDWNDVATTMTASAKDAKASLVLVLDAPGKVWFDYVSLFPEATYKGRSNGLRPDLAQLVADLKPSFMRWPGGTVVGGITNSTRFRWKETLGDPAARPGELFTWGYRASYGLGYHEMLQYVEDIGADFMFVCSNGIGDQHRMGDADDNVDFYINDCLDAIEYAIGPASSTWGSKRAAAGHPAPFALKYVEIGNELGGKEYDRRFPMFYDAIKKRYPQLKIINNKSAPKDVASAPKTDFFDPHFYGSAESFFLRASQYDSYPRGNYGVYIGEYACNSRVNFGNITAALCEAAFISGLERNGDLITMTSYAPLFENVNDRKWPVNLIRFDSDKAYGRSSYYVQKMAAEHRPTYNVWNSFPQGTPMQIDINTSATKVDVTKNVPLQFLSSGYDEVTGELVLKFVNASASAFSTLIQLNGATEIKKQGKVITLAAANDKDENTFEEPRKIYPKETVLSTFGNSFRYDFPAFSYSVLRIKTK